MQRSQSPGPIVGSGNTIDLRLHQPRERLDWVVYAIGALAPGDDLAFLTSDSPDRLRNYLHDQYNGALELAILERGTDLWALHVRRKPSANSTRDTKTP